MYRCWCPLTPHRAALHFKHVASNRRSTQITIKTASVTSRGSVIAASAIAFGTYFYSSEAQSGVSPNSVRNSSSSFWKRPQHGGNDVDATKEVPAARHDGSKNSEDASSESNPKAQPWASFSDKVSKALLPDWAKVVPEFIEKLQRELAMEPGTLGYEMWQEANDPEVNPEIIWEASVRLSDDLCKEEKDFLRKRKLHTTKALAKYLDVPEEEIDPEDVPTIAMCGSGGGLRALVAGTSSYAAAQKVGLFDCVTYTAGVSGSCWLQTLYYSSVSGQRPDGIIKHLKHRLGVHIAYPPTLLKLLTSAPTNKFLLSGGFEKYQVGKDSDFGLVDIYGLLLGARLLVPKGDLGIDYSDLKISNQRRYIDDGHHPLPIYTSVRHEIPLRASDDISNEEVREKAKAKAWFQWFEQTPYELWCEELQAGIPSWAAGRKFSNGRSVFRENGLSIPEIGIPLLMGMWGSAFCATVSHYYQEIRPLLLTFGALGGLDELITQRDDDLIKLHPVDPGKIPNFVLGMRDSLPASTPESIHTSEHLQLMDAGMSNNLPIYPLLRPGRDVDIVIVFDASADVKKDNWLRVADGYARQRQIHGWPIGTGWPDTSGPSEDTARELDAADKATSLEAEGKLKQAQRDQTQTQESDTKRDQKSSSKSSHPSSGKVAQSEKRGSPDASESKDLSFCNVWVGTTSERTYSDKSAPSSPRIKDTSEDWRLMEPDAGIAVVYFPFLPNPEKVAGVDPHTSEFMSTWNFIYTPEQVDKVVQLASANFEEGEDLTKQTVRAVWERKRKHRLEGLRERKEERKQWKVRLGVAHRKGEGDHGDHFS